MPFSRYVLATAFMVVCSLPTASSTYAKVTFYNNGGNCADDGVVMYYYEDADAHATNAVSTNCLPLVTTGNHYTTYLKATAAASGSVEFYSTPDCTGAADSTVNNGDTACKTVNVIKLKVSANSQALPAISDTPYKKYTVGSAACDTAPHIIEELKADNGGAAECTETGFVSGQSSFVAKKMIVKPISGATTLVTEAYYSDTTCASDVTWASKPVPLTGCIATYVGTGADLACAGGAPCGTLGPTSGTRLSYYYDKGGTHNDPKNYAKLRYYQDRDCKVPKTYHDPSTADITGKASYTAANVAQTGQLNTDKMNFTVGEQVYDGWALGQARYFEVDYGNSGVCTVIETGVGATVGAVKAIECSTTSCSLKPNADCTGTQISLIDDASGNVQTGCNADLYAKAESFKTGIEYTSNDFLRLDFHSDRTTVGANGETWLSQECGNRPSILQGLLDTCQVNSDVSKGHTWLAVQERYRCSGDWENEYAAATVEKDVSACQALCHSTVDCKAISWGRTQSDYHLDNHKCVLCKKGLVEGHGYWDTYTKSAVPTFVRVTGGRGSSASYHTNYYSTSDCSGSSFSDPEIRNVGTCRSTKNRAGNFYQGAMVLPSTMSAVQNVQGVLGQGFDPAGDASVSDEVGCPEKVNYVYTEGEYDIGQSNGVNDHRVCTIKFQGPPGTTLSFDWTTVAIQTGSCSFSAGTPSDCVCNQESIAIRDGLRAESQQVGQPICGSTGLPNRIVFSGNTARIDFEAIHQTSTFKVWVNHHYTKVNFHLPANPTFALGSDISIQWSLDSSVGGWDECGSGQNSMPGTEQSQLHGVGKKTPQDERWQRRFTCARSSQSDHGWIGIYRNGTCEDGAMIPHATTDNPADIKVGFRANAYSQGQQPHECYLGYRSIPVKETRGTVIFKWNEDYNDAGWYSLRYFAGDSAGTLCEVLATSKVYDPENIKNEQCLYSPVTRGEIYVSADRQSFSGVTERSQLPGYERTINY
jgi:hypothetical protein